MEERKYLRISKHYESTLKKYGPNYKGMDWPSIDDVLKRFEVMLGVMQRNHSNAVPTLLDLGCGVGHLLQYIKEKRSKLRYVGSDISEEMIKEARKLHPMESFEVRDILTRPYAQDQFDFVVMNGIMTEKVDLSQEEMVSFAKDMIVSAYNTAAVGIAFNVMSSHVDWTRNDLFHWPLDEAVSFMIKHCSRNIRIRMDYGLYEYTVYLYKTPLL